MLLKRSKNTSIDQLLLRNENQQNSIKENEIIRKQKQALCNPNQIKGEWGKPIKTHFPLKMKQFAFSYYESKLFHLVLTTQGTI